MGKGTLNVDTSLASAKLLDKNSVLAIAKYHINNYMKNDSQTKGKIITPSSDFINLYDLDDNLFAYMVPLLENGNEIGYITVGAIEDGFDTYSIYISDNYTSKVKAKIQQKKELISKTADSKLVFIPSLYYFIKVKDGQTEKYFDISQDINNDIDATNNVISKKEEIKKIYSTIRSNENKTLLQKNIQSVTSASTSAQQLSATVTVEDVRLVNEAQGSFVPVFYGTTTFYGGNQNWYSDSTKRSRGCGPTAAANITNYLAKGYPYQWGKLYSQPSMYELDFIKHMDLMYGYLTPGVVGVVQLSAFADGVEAWARFNNQPLSRVTFTDSLTQDNMANFIKYGLIDDQPVATLNLQPPNTGYEYAWHWMTITKYFRDVNDNRFLAVSSWGTRYSINYYQHFNAINLYGGGNIYFQ